MNKLLGMRDSTKKVRVIKPSVLSKLFLDAAGNTDSEMER